MPPETDFRQVPDVLVERPKTPHSQGGGTGSIPVEGATQGHFQSSQPTHDRSALQSRVPENDPRGR